MREQRAEAEALRRIPGGGEIGLGRARLTGLGRQTATEIGGPRRVAIAVVQTDFLSHRRAACLTLVYNRQCS